MWVLCHYVGDVSAQSFLIVHQLVMCQNFLMLRYPMLIADGAVPFFFKMMAHPISNASSRRLITQYDVFSQSILIVHNLGTVKNFYRLIVENHIYKILLPVHIQVPMPTYSQAPPYEIQCCLILHTTLFNINAFKLSIKLI